MGMCQASVGSPGRRVHCPALAEGWTRAVHVDPKPSAHPFPRVLRREPGPLATQDHRMDVCHGLPGSGYKSQSLASENLAFHKTVAATRGRQSSAFLVRLGTGKGGPAGWSHPTSDLGPTDVRAVLRPRGAWG